MDGGVGEGVGGCALMVAARSEGEVMEPQEGPLFPAANTGTMPSARHTSSMPL